MHHTVTSVLPSPSISSRAVSNSRSTASLTGSVQVCISECRGDSRPHSFAHARHPFRNYTGYSGIYYSQTVLTFTPCSHYSDPLKITDTSTVQLPPFSILLVFLQPAWPAPFWSQLISFLTITSICLGCHRYCRRLRSLIQTHTSYPGQRLGCTHCHNFAFPMAIQVPLLNFSI